MTKKEQKDELKKIYTDIRTARNNVQNGLKATSLIARDLSVIQTKLYHVINEK